MQFNFRKPDLKAASLLLNAVLLLAVIFLYSNNVVEHKALKEESEKLINASAKNKEMANSIGDLTAKIQELEHLSNSSSEGSMTQDQIESFAKQAASCELLKKKLHIKN